MVYQLIYFCQLIVFGTDAPPPGPDALTITIMPTPDRTASRTNRHRAGAARRPERGGYARGEDTHRRILEAAIELFGQHGFQGASTRAIAQRARVSLPALQYYFGGKQGLHEACVDYVTQDVRIRLGPAADRARRVLDGGELTRSQLLELLRSVFEPFLEGLATDRPESWALFFARTQSEATGAIFERIGGRLVTLIAEIVGRLTGSSGGPEPSIRAIAIIGQAVLMRRARPVILKALGWPDFAGERLGTLKSVLWRSIEASLGAPAEAGPDDARPRTGVRLPHPR